MTWTTMHHSLEDISDQRIVDFFFKSANLVENEICKENQFLFHFFNNIFLATDKAQLIRFHVGGKAFHFAKLRNNEEIYEINWNEKSGLEFQSRSEFIFIPSEQLISSYEYVKAFSFPLNPCYKEVQRYYLPTSLFAVTYNYPSSSKTKFDVNFFSSFGYLISLNVQEKENPILITFHDEIYNDHRKFIVKNFEESERVDISIVDNREEMDYLKTKISLHFRDRSCKVKGENLEGIAISVERLLMEKVSWEI